MSEQIVKVVRTAIGRVVSAKMDKTIVVQIERKVPHPKYGKYIKHISKRFAHDEANECRQGDVVEIRETRPLSRHKSWTLVKVLESAPAQ